MVCIISNAWVDKNCMCLHAFYIHIITQLFDKLRNQADNLFYSYNKKVYWYFRLQSGMAKTNHIGSYGLTFVQN